jgi:primase-polymerase (primpol)-like protein
VDEALAVVEKRKYDGIGFVFTEKDDTVAVDLDKCIIDGKLNEVATGFLAKAPRTYVEISQSKWNKRL